MVVPVNTLKVFSFDLWTLITCALTDSSNILDVKLDEFDQQTDMAQRWPRDGTNRHGPEMAPFLVRKYFIKSAAACSSPF